MDLHEVIVPHKKSRLKNQSHGNSTIFATITDKTMTGLTMCSVHDFFVDADSQKTIDLSLECSSISDDACIIVLEALIVDYFSRTQAPILYLKFPNMKQRSVSTEMLRLSLFSLFSKNSLPFECALPKTNFIEAFEQKRHSWQGAYRHISNISDNRSDFAQDAETILKTKSAIPEQFLESFYEVACEIVSNACEHGKAPCISQVKVLSGFSEKKTGKPIVYVSSSFVSFSSETISSTLKEFITISNTHEKGEENVRTALSMHDRFFTEGYDEDSFYTLSAFQLGVSSRQLFGQGGGGTGLTQLLRELQKHALAERCYVLSGNTCLFFVKDQIEVNEDGTVGFNSTGDYFNAPPSPECHAKQEYSFCGTLFNFVFIIEEKETNR